MPKLPYIPFFRITSYNPSGGRIVAETSHAASALEEARSMYNLWNKRSWADTGYVRVVAFKHSLVMPTAHDKADGIMIYDVGNDDYAPKELY